MKKIITAFAIIASTMSFSQVGIGTNTPSAKSILDLTATDKGFLLPRMTSVQRVAIAPNNTTDRGMQVYDTNTASIWYWNGTTWIQQGFNTIYNADGSLSGNRIVTQGTNTLSFTSTATTGTSHFTVDGTTFNVDAVNNRVGIGRANPAATLDVRASGATAPQMIVASTTNGIDENYGTLYRSSTAGAYFGYIGNTTLGTTWGSISAAAVIAGGDKSFGIKAGGNSSNLADAVNNNPDLYIQGFNNPEKGFIGMGTAGPTEKLHVIGNIRFSGAIMPNNLPGAAGQFLTSTGAGNSPTWTTLSSSNTPNLYTANGTLSGNRIVTQGTNTLAFTSTAVNSFSVDGTTFSVDAANNRVGIGTNTPQSRLNVVNNNESVGGSQDDYIFESYGGAAEPAQAMVLFGSRGTSTAPVNLATGDLMSEIFFGGRWNGQNNYFGNNSVIRAEYTGSGTTNLTNMSFWTSGATRLTINANGSLTSFNGATLTVGGVWTNASDSRLKSDILATNYGLAEVLKLRPVQYTMNIDKSKQVGFIAQEVQKIIPEVVSGIEGDVSKGETLGVSYGNLVPVLTKAIQEQQKQIEELKLEIAKLKK